MIRETRAYVRGLRERRRPRLSLRAALEAQGDIATTLLSVRSDTGGLTVLEAERRLGRLGENRIVVPEVQGTLQALAGSLGNACVLILLATAGLALLASTANLPGVAVLLGAVALVALAALYRASRNRQALASLDQMAGTTADVLRRDDPGSEPSWRRVPSTRLVPGDVVRLDTGFRVPADVRLIESSSLHVNQSLITGDAVPVRKIAGSRDAQGYVQGTAGGFDPPGLPNVCLLGSFVARGSGTAVIVATGDQTYFGSVARQLFADAAVTAGVSPGTRVRILLLRLLLLAPVIAAFRAGWGGGESLPQLAALLGMALLFVLPELFPRLFTPGGLGADPLATMAGWLGAPSGAQPTAPAPAGASPLRLMATRDADGRESLTVLRYAWLLSHHNASSRNAVDAAVLGHVAERPGNGLGDEMTLVAEIPFDMRRRRTSLVVAGADGQQLLICRGTVEDVLGVSAHVRIRADTAPLDGDARARLRELAREQGQQGRGVQLVATRFFPPDSAKRIFGPADEQGLTVEGLLALAAEQPGEPATGAAGVPGVEAS